MTQEARELLERVLRLAPAERLALAREIVESVEDDTPEAEEEELAGLDPELLAELRRRAERARSGEAEPGIPAEAALADVERRLAERPHK